MHTRLDKNSQGIGTLAIIIAVLVIAGIGLAGYFTFHQSKSTTESSTTTTTKNSPSTNTKQTTKAASNTTETDPTDGGKYLVIKEWGVRVQLPQALIGKVSYTQVTTTTDPDSGLSLDSAKIYIAKNAFDASANDCAVTNTNLGDSYTSGAQYIRSDNAKPFNAARYKGAFQANILKEEKYSFHLNYIIPDCLPGNTDAELMTALADLKTTP